MTRQTVAVHSITTSNMLERRGHQCQWAFRGAWSPAASLSAFQIVIPHVLKFGKSSTFGGPQSIAEEFETLSRWLYPKRSSQLLAMHTVTVSWKRSVTCLVCDRLDKPKNDPFCSRTMMTNEFLECLNLYNNTVTVKRSCIIDEPHHEKSIWCAYCDWRNKFLIKTSGSQVLVH